MKTRKLNKLKLLIAILSFSSFCIQLCYAQTAKVAIEITPKPSADTLILILYHPEYLGLKAVKSHQYTTYEKTSKLGKFSFEIPLKNGLGYFELKMKNEDKMEPLFRPAILSPGDNLLIKREGELILVTGEGSEKVNFSFHLANHLNQLRKKIMDTLKVPPFENRKVENIYRSVEQDIRATNYFLEEINNSEDYTEEVKQLLMVETINFRRGTMLKIEIDIWNNKYFNIQEIKTIKSYFDKLVGESSLNSSPTVLKSVYYLDLYYTIAKMQNKFSNGSLNLFDTINQIANLELKEKILTFYLVKNAQNLKNIDSLATISATKLKNRYYLDELDHIKQNIAKMKVAKNFELFNSNGKTVKLSDFKGKVVFLDFWFPGCSACVIYNEQTLNKVEELYQANNDVVFINIAIVKEYKKWREAISSGKYTGKHSINLTTGAKGWAHQVVKDYQVASAPKPFLISKKGEIFASDSEAMGRSDFRNLVATIEECLKIN